MSANKDYYQILNVGLRASQFQIKRAYRTLALQSHPDLVPSEHKEEAEKVFKRIVEAYYVLGKRERRKIYDLQRTTEQSIIKFSEIWSFVEPTQRLFDEDSFNYYFNEQRAHCDALQIDWREVLGGSVARVLAGILFLLLFTFGQETFISLSLNLGVARLSLPVLVAVLYIILEVFRDFFWEYIGDDEIYDTIILAICWLILIGSLIAIVLKPSTSPQATPNVPVTNSIKEPANDHDKYPVNLEIFNVNTDPSQKIPMKNKREI